LTNNIFHLNSNTTSGGAATSAVALHTALLKSGYKSFLINFKEQEKEKNIQKIPKFYRIIAKFQEMIFSNFVLGYTANHYSLNIFATGIFYHLNKIIKPDDLIIIHWIGRELISFSDLAKLNCKKILVVHDLWYCGGPSHVSEEIGSSAIVAYHQAQKSAFLESVDYILTPSRYMQLKMIEATKTCPILFRNQPPEVFNSHKLIKDDERSGLVLGTADVSDVHKGGNLIVPFVEKLKEKNNTLIIKIVGNLDNKTYSRLEEMGCILLGKVSKRCLHNELENSRFYVTLSQEDNFPNMLLEAGLLGCRLYGFNIGGHQEIIHSTDIGVCIEKQDIDALVDQVCLDIDLQWDHCKIQEQIKTIFFGFNIEYFSERFLNERK
jgi:glycosyltransferase involved in cell wall biosynthesis